MFNADVLTFREFAMQESLPLSVIHGAVLEFLRGRADVVVFGAQAVNAYVSEPRMTQDVDLVSTRATDMAQELRDYLSDRFHIAVRVREIGESRGYRLYQVQKSGNRHLVNVRAVETLPLARRIEEIMVMAPAEVIASKVIAYASRRGQPKSGTDWRDLAMLLLVFPDLKLEASLVSDCLKAAGAGPDVFDVWKDLVATEILSASEDDEF